MGNSAAPAASPSLTLTPTVNMGTQATSALTDNPNAVISEGWGDNTTTNQPERAPMLGMVGQEAKDFGSWKVDQGKVVSNGKWSSSNRSGVGSKGWVSAAQRNLATQYADKIGPGGGNGATLIPGSDNTSSASNGAVSVSGDGATDNSGTSTVRANKNRRGASIGKSLIGNSTAGGNTTTGGNSMLGG